MFYDRLNSLCKQNKTTITQFASENGLNKSTPNGWKRGSSPSADIVIKAALHFNVTTDYLLDMPVSSDNSMPLDDDEMEMLSAWRNADSVIRNAAMAVLRSAPSKKTPAGKYCPSSVDSQAGA